MWVQHIDESCPRLSTQVVFTAAISKIFSCILAFCLSALCVLQWAPRWDLLCHRNSVEREPSIKGRLDKVSSPLSALSLYILSQEVVFCLVIARAFMWFGMSWGVDEAQALEEEDVVLHGKRRKLDKPNAFIWFWSKRYITQGVTMSSHSCVRVPKVRLASGSLLWCT